MRPYHAGFLGTDTLVILDEAHLVPSFEKLLENHRHRRGCVRAARRDIAGADPATEANVALATGGARPDRLGRKTRISHTPL